ncbi:hypothetical protein R3P38DRAFT_3227809 [Favolaschia claudopus]|uniref:Uncharacterized protein n=1 Tax=Favolaschia claudopus TaxID=2862362 RepID=A0AAV9ZRY2_9AGAR
MSTNSAKSATDIQPSASSGDMDIDTEAANAPTDTIPKGHRGGGKPRSVVPDYLEELRDRMKAVHLKDELDEARDDCDDERKEVDHLRSQLDLVDEGRARKRTAPSPSINRHQPRVETAPKGKSVIQTRTDGDVNMADVPTKNTVPVISNWHEAIPGLTGQILKTYFENPKSFPPAKGSWKTNKMGVPIDIPSWDAAYEFVHTYQSWSVGLGVFHVYMDARTAAANQNPQTGLHRHVLLKYFMPVWFFQELKKSLHSGPL